EESVRVDLIDDQPTGQGSALGIGVDNRVIVLEADGRKTVHHASKVDRGALVLGYVGVGQPSRGEGFRVRADVQDAWFRVVEKRTDTRAHVEELQLGDETSFLFGPEHRILLALGQSAVWGKAGELRFGSEFWDKLANGKGPPVLRRSVDHPAVPMVE